MHLQRLFDYLGEEVEIRVESLRSKLDQQAKKQVKLIDRFQKKLLKRVINKHHGKEQKVTGSVNTIGKNKKSKYFSCCCEDSVLDKAIIGEFKSYGFDIIKDSTENTAESMSVLQECETGDVELLFDKEDDEMDHKDTDQSEFD